MNIDQIAASEPWIVLQSKSHDKRRLKIGANEILMLPTSAAFTLRDRHNATLQQSPPQSRDRHASEQDLLMEASELLDKHLHCNCKWDSGHQPDCAIVKARDWRNRALQPAPPPPDKIYRIREMIDRYNNGDDQRPAVDIVSDIEAILE